MLESIGEIAIAINTWILANPGEFWSGLAVTGGAGVLKGSAQLVRARSRLREIREQEEVDKRVRERLAEEQRARLADRLLVRPDWTRSDLSDIARFDPKVDMLLRSVERGRRSGSSDSQMSAGRPHSPASSYGGPSYAGGGGIDLEEIFDALKGWAAFRELSTVATLVFFASAVVLFAITPADFLSLRGFGFVFLGWLVVPFAVGIAAASLQTLLVSCADRLPDRAGAVIDAVLRVALFSGSAGTALLITRRAFFWWTS